MKQTSNIQRKSGIELLKILAIVLIIISHVVQTLGNKGNAFIAFDDYWVNIYDTTTNIQVLVIAMLRYSGELGNTIFFICSAWFLLDNDKLNVKKSLVMIIDMWLISILILGAVLIVEHGNVHKVLVIRSLFPLLFENNWYIVCYLVFYAFHPVLNYVINNYSKRSLLRMVLTGIILYPVTAFLLRPLAHIWDAGTTFFSSRLITWSLIYCLIGYIKHYEQVLLNSKKTRLNCVLFGFLGTYGLILFTNLVDLVTGKLRGALQIWNQPYNPCIFALTFGLFLYALNSSFMNKTINRISSLSLYIYVIHENLLLRTLYRPAVWQYIYSNYGYRYILGWVFILVIVIFIVSLIISVIYKRTVHELAVKLGANLYSPLVTRWKQLEEKVLHI